MNKLSALCLILLTQFLALPAYSETWIRTRTTKRCIYEVDVDSRITRPPGITEFRNRATCYGKTGTHLMGFAMCKTKPWKVLDTEVWIPVSNIIQERTFWDVGMYGAATICAYEVEPD